MGGLMVDARGEPISGGGGGGGGAGVLSTAGLTPYSAPSGGVPLGALVAGAAAATIIPAIVLLNGVEHNVMWDTETGQVVEDLGPVDPAQTTYDDNGNATQVDGSIENVESIRMERSNQLAADERAAKEAAAAAANAAPAAAAPVYDDTGTATDSTGGSSSGSRRKSSGGSTSGGSSSGGSSGGGLTSGTTDTTAGWPFADGFGSSPNTYPTLPMTAQRQKVLQNLSGVFPNAGQFRTPPGGWREDMAPMFTTGAFGPVTPPADTASGAIPGGPPPLMIAPAAPAPAPAPSAPSLPDPTLMPPGAELGIAPPEDPYAAPALPAGFPAFNRPGFVAPGSPAAMQMQRQVPQPGGNAAPLPASLRQRFGL